MIQQNHGFAKLVRRHDSLIAQQDIEAELVLLPRMPFFGSAVTLAQLIKAIALVSRFSWGALFEEALAF